MSGGSNRDRPSGLPSSDDEPFRSVALHLPVSFRIPATAWSVAQNRIWRHATRATSTTTSLCVRTCSRTADGVRPQRLDRLFECLEGVVRTCPECSKKKLPLGALIVHLNDAHHWTRERIAAWVADPDVPQDESHAHH